MTTATAGGRTVRRGYGKAHREAREKWEPVVAAGEGVCAEDVCLVEAEGGTRHIEPGSDWDLAHTDDRKGYKGPAHGRCNDSEAGKRGNVVKATKTSHKRDHAETPDPSCRWCVEEAEAKDAERVAAEAFQGVQIVRMDPRVPIDSLRRYYRNPRRGDVKAIRQSIATNGFVDALVVNIGTKTGRENEILGGNHRWEAAHPGGRVKVLDEAGERMVEVEWAGLEFLPCSFVDVDNDRAAKIVVALNRLADKATNDADVMRDLLSDMAVGPESLEGSGYTLEDLAKFTVGNAQEGDADVDDITEVQWGVVVQVDGEEDQVELLERLSSEGYNVRALMR